jgi:hypothetical protein
MARILVGAKEAVIGLETGKAHSYLVFEDDAGARSVTSLTDVRSDVFPPSLRFDVEQIGTPYDQAEETDDPDRVERPLDLDGRDAGAVWSLVTQHAEEIRDEAPAYNPLTQNSNSFVASLLNVVGVDLERNLPGFDGENPTSDPEPGDYPGLRNLLDFDYELVGTDASDVIRGAGGDDRFRGEGGDDTLVGQGGRTRSRAAPDSTRSPGPPRTRASTPSSISPRPPTGCGWTRSPPGSAAARSSWSGSSGWCPRTTARTACSRWTRTVPGPAPAGGTWPCCGGNRGWTRRRSTAWATC